MSRRRSLALAAALAAALVAPTALAADLPEHVQLSIERYERLLAGADAQTGVRPAWSRGSVRVGLTADGSALRVVLSASLSVPAGASDFALVPVLPSEVVIESVTANGSDAPIVQHGGVHALRLTPGQTSASISATYLVPVRDGAGGGVTAIVPVPSLPGAQLDADVGVPAADLDVWPVSGASRSGTRVTASLAATSALVLRWAGAAATEVLRVDYAVRPDASGDGVDVTATFDVDVRDRDATLRVARATAALVSLTLKGQPLSSRVEGDWHHAVLRTTGRQTVVATFRLLIDRSQGQPQVDLPLTRIPITRVEVTVPGKRAVTFDPAVAVSSSIRGEGDDALTTAIAHLPPSDGTRIHWTESRAAPEAVVRVNTETFQLLTLDEGVLRSRVVLRYQVIRGKVKELPVEIPEGVVLYKVVGDGLEDWRTFAPTDDAPRQVRVFLGRELEGDYTLELELETIVSKTEGAELQLPIVRPLGAFRERGVVALFDGDKVGFAEATQTGYTKAGEDALPVEIRKDLKDTVSQAFKHIGEPGPVRSAVAPAKERDARFAARVETLYEVREGALRGQASVLLEVKSGRQDAVVISLPAGVTEPNVTAPSLNKVEPAEDFAAGEGRRAWRVRFTQALEGAIQLDVIYELILPKELGRTGVPDLIVHGAENQQGALGLTAETGFEVTPVELKDLRKVDVSELPKAIRLRSEREVQFGYQYAFVPWGLALDIKLRRTVETRDAVAGHAWLETTALDNGHVETRAVFEVSNEDRPFFRLALPAGADVLRVSEGGRAVKAVADDEAGTIAIPLPKNATTTIEVIYSQRGDELGALGSLALVAPKPDVRVSDLQWLVRAPADLAIYSVDTPLKEREAYEYRPPELFDDGASVPIAVPVGDELQTRLYTYAVLDEAAEPLPLTLRFAATPGEGMAALLALLALLLLALAIWRRASGAGLGLVGVVALLVGVVALGLRLAGWGLDGSEVALGLAVLVVVALLGARAGVKRRAAAREEPA